MEQDHSLLLRINSCHLVPDHSAVSKCSPSEKTLQSQTLAPCLSSHWRQQVPVKFGGLWSQFIHPPQSRLRPGPRHPPGASICRTPPPPKPSLALLDGPLHLDPLSHVPLKFVYLQLGARDPVLVAVVLLEDAPGSDDSGQRRLPHGNIPGVRGVAKLTLGRENLCSPSRPGLLHPCRCGSKPV